MKSDSRRGPRPVYGALDIGTSSIKAMLLDVGPAISLSLVGSAETGVQRPAAGQAEIDPEAVWRQAVELLGELFAAARQRGGRVVRLGLTGHISSAICMDKAGRLLPPFPIWQDQRCAGEADEFFALFGGKLKSRLGVRFFKGTNWPAPKLRWLARHHPKVLERTACIFQIKDLIFQRLTGMAWSDPPSWLGLAHLTRGMFHPEVLSWCGVRAEQLPSLHDPAESAPLKAALAKQWGLRNESLPQITVGTADMAASFLAFALRPKQGMYLAATAELIGVAIERGKAHRMRPGVVRYPLSRSVDLIYGATANGGASVQWLQEAVGPFDIEDLSRQAAVVPPGADGLIFLPYLTGDRAPLWDHRLAGAFVGLRAVHGKAHMLRAVLEGCAFSKRHVLQTGGFDRRGAIDMMKIAGGSARSDLWNRIRASVMGLPLHVLPWVDLSTLGAACLAAAPEHPNLAEQCLASMQCQTVQHDPLCTAAYDRAYERYMDFSRILRRYHGRS